MEKTQTHYYVFNDKRYENMRDCREAIGTGIKSTQFKHMLACELVKKISI